MSDNELDITHFLKAINMKLVIESIACEIGANTIRQSWRKLVPLDTAVHHH